MSTCKTAQIRFTLTMKKWWRNVYVKYYMDDDDDEGCVGSLCLNSSQIFVHSTMKIGLFDQSKMPNTTKYNIYS